MAIIRDYRIEGRNGHYAVDEYLGGYKGDREYLNGSVERTVATGLTRKQATQLANALLDAVFLFRRDNGILGDTSDEV